MTSRARAPFILDSWDPETIEDGPGAALGRVRITKTFSGDIEGTSVVEMLTAVSTVEGSAAYVAFERVTGTLAGRSGTFVLHHTATSSAGEQSGSWTVVPDSATGDLTGLSGKGDITIGPDGAHTFLLDYDLP